MTRTPARRLTHCLEAEWSTVVCLRTAAGWGVFVVSERVCCTCHRQESYSNGTDAPGPWIYCPGVMALIGAFGDDWDETGETMGCGLHMTRVEAEARALLVEDGK